MQVDELYELGDDILESNRQVRLSVGGYSMFPLLRCGDEIIIDRCPVSDLNTGDIIVFKRGTKWISHRLYKIRPENNKNIFYTRGDTCRQKDPAFSEDNYIGKVVSYFRNGKEMIIDGADKRKKNLHFVKFSWFLIFYYRLILKLYQSNKTAKDIYKKLVFVCKRSKRLTYAGAVISVLQGMLPFVIIYLFKYLVDSIWKINAYSDKTDVAYSLFIIIGITAFVFLLSALLNVFNGELRERHTQSVSLYIHDLLHRKHSELNMACLEDPSQQDKIHRAVQEAGYRPQKMISESFSLIQSVISWIVIAVLLLHIHWIIFVLILVAVVPGFLVRLKFSKKMYYFRKESSPKEREAYYYNRIMTSMPFSKEIRLFGSGGYFSERYHKVQDALYTQKNALLRKQSVANIIAQVFAISLIFLSFGLVAYLAVKGKVSVGTVVLFFFIFQRGYAVLKDFMQSIAGLYEDHVFLGDFFDFLDLSSGKVNTTNEKLNFEKKNIIIKNVSFSYPSSSRKALDTVTMEIPAGKSVALVGPNGSGKTTLVKLLCGFYLPDKGKILFGGTDISQIPADEIRKQITAVFQDFALYNMTAAENIFLGDLSKTPSSEKIKQAAVNAGIDDILEKLPSGYNNIIGNLFAKGEELSIGQWQKMAIARAFYRNAPLLLMDEPSSALDVETELQLLQKLKTLAKDKSVLIISHRLSAIKWADIIYVMENGSIIERGSHEELIIAKGKYSKMYEENRNL